MTLVEWTCYAGALAALDAEETLRRAEAAALPWLADRDRRRSLHRLRRLIGLSTHEPTAPVEGLALRHHRPESPSPT